jgi:DNA-binding XRE family transcriptional regulator
MERAPMAVVETKEFLKQAKPLMSDSERAEVVAFVGANPEAGEIIPETGGVRKIRWAREGMGKRGGARVIYYYHNEPQVDVRQVRRKMGLSQAQFATKFGLPPATLRNWEQGRAHPDAPTRVLLAVIAKHPEAVEDVLRKAS